MNRDEKENIYNALMQVAEMIRDDKISSFVMAFGETEKVAVDLPDHVGVNAMIGLAGMQNELEGLADVIHEKVYGHRKPS